MHLEEEVLDADDIQGNILAGFNKDYEVFLFLGMPRDEDGLEAVRAWLRGIAKQLSSLAEVGSFNKLFSAMRKRLGDDPPDIIATWLNIAFSASALRALTSAADVDQFADQFFKDGLHMRSGGLGDPTDAASPGHPENWVVGGTRNDVDILLIVASDSPTALSDRSNRLKAALPPELVVLWEQPGETLDAPLTGHEHFGFKDGISQPAVRGLLRASPAQFLTPRLFDAEQFPQADPLLPEFAKPGQPLVWPGQFVFGYLRQSMSDPRAPPAPPQDKATACPWWGRNGSFLVLRRLRQDVAAFRQFMRAVAATLTAEPGFSGLTATQFASMCVGRWPSGAPLMRSRASDDANLGNDTYADNFFQYAADSPPPARLKADVGYAGDAFPLSRRDDKGITCPFSAHVRKVNPRDTITEQGNAFDTLARLLLRRGIPFGPPYPGTLEADDPSDPGDDQVERGLIFVSYQTSIEEQFAFLQNSWANHTQNPNGEGGEDPIIGQADRTGNGARFFNVRSAGQPIRTIPIEAEWVIPTGGGFFFSPAISVVAEVLGKAP